MLIPSLAISLYCLSFVDLKRTRDKYLKELSDIGRSLRSVEQEQQLSSQISGLQNRIKFSRQDLVRYSITRSL